jgi:predicted ATPase/DNA-binding winged helix-turn-helix (wHTH) protein
MVVSRPEGESGVADEAVRRHLELGEARVDLETGEVVRGGVRTATLTTLERKALAYLADRPGQDVSQDTLLVEVWGYKRGVASRAAYFTLRRLRQEIEPDPAHPRHIVTVHGVGYRFVPVDGPASVAPSAAPLAAHNLVPEPTVFVGRVTERDRLLARLPQRPRLITLLGPGGAGKTRLAIELGFGWLAAALGEVWFVPLVDARSSAEVVTGVALALGVPLRPDDTPEAAASQIGRALAARGPVLLLLDNAEHLTAAVAPWVRGWLVAAPNLSVLVTSRVRLRVAGEVIERLGPLAPADALALLLSRAADHGVVLDPSDPDLAALVARLDGLPLALELAASRLATHAPVGLLRRLDDRLTLLRGATRHRADSLQVALESSWALLAAPDADAFAALSVFPNGFWLADAEVVFGSEMTDAVERLLDASLLTASPHPELGELRFRMLETIGLFAASKRRGHPEEADWRDRAARHAAARGHALGDAIAYNTDPHATVQLALLAPDLATASEHPDAAVAMGAIGALLRLAGTQGPATEAARWQAAALRRARAEVPAAVPYWEAMQALAASGTAAAEGVTAALGHLEALLRAGEVDLARDLAPALIQRGAALGRVGDALGALQACAHLPPPASLHGRWRMGQSALVVHALANDLQAADRAAQAVLSLVAEAGLTQLPYLNLGPHASRMGDPRTAAQRYAHDLAIYQAQGAHGHTARTRMNLAIAYANLGDRRAFDEIGEAVSSIVRSGLTGQLPLAYNNWGHFHLFADQWAEAEERANRAVEGAIAQGNAYVLAEARNLLAWVACLRGDASTCVAQLEAALAVNAPTGHALQRSQLLATGALQAARVGDEAVTRSCLAGWDGHRAALGGHRAAFTLATLSARARWDPTARDAWAAARAEAAAPDATGEAPLARSCLLRLVWRLTAPAELIPASE